VTEQATRVPGSNDEEGSPHPCEPFTHQLSAHVRDFGRSVAHLEWQRSRKGPLYKEALSGTSVSFFEED